MYDRVVQSGISTQRVGVANMQGLTLFRNVGPASHEAPQQEAESAAMPLEEGQPHLWLAALLVLVAALWITNQHFSFGPLNLAFVILTVIAGTVLLKTIFGRVHIPGLSQVILAA
jgi:hypothetical protein